MFRQVGDDRYTCVAPPGLDVDPAVTAAIREFDPGIIPIWRLQLWLVPGLSEPIVTVHHGIGRYYPVPRYARRHFHVDMPADADFPAPNFLDAIFEDTKTVACKMGGPGGYIPFGWNAYYWCRWQYDRITVDKWLTLIDRRRASLERFRKAFEEDIEYRKRQIEPWILKKLDGVSDADWKEALELMWNKPKGYSLREKKPFVQVGGSPPPAKTYGRVAPV